MEGFHGACSDHDVIDADVIVPDFALLLGAPNQAAKSGITQF